VSEAVDTGDSARWLDADQQKSWRALIMGTTLLMDRLNDELRERHDLSLTKYEILVRLSEAKDQMMRMAHLAESLAHSRSRMTHTIANMEDAGLVDRFESPDDGRGIYAKLTAKGLALLAEAAPTHVEGVRRHLVDRADPADFAALGRVLNSVADKLVAEPEMDIRQ
jgi:DNA-binding MarR family transcriptional regulator